MNPQIKTTYQGGEALPTIGSTGYNEVLKLSGFQPSNVLDAGNLTQGTSTPTFNFQPVNSASTNLSAQVGSVINGISTAPTATATPTAQPVTDRNTILERLYSLIGMQGEQTGRTADIQEEVGLFKKQEALTKLENDITARAKAWDDQVKELEKNKEGLSDQGLQIRRNALLKDKNSELADLSIQYKVANDDVQGALALAESKVASEFEPIANEIDALKGLYSLYGSDLTDSEKILLQDQINEKQSAMDFERQKALLGYKAMIDMANFSSQSGFNLSPQQETRLNGIINTYSKDGIIQQGQQAQQIYNITDAIIANPNNPGNQLTALYTLVKNLDPDSAVREGELDLANKTNTFIGKYQDSLTRISTGRVLNPTATIELANAAQALADEWVNSAERRQTQYGSQANVFGLSDPFNTYLSGFAGFAKRPGTDNDENEQIFQEVTGANKSFFGNVFSGIGNFFSRNNDFN